MADGQTGVAISLMVPATTANALALPIEGALPPSELHITLAYLGDTEETEIDRDALLAHLEKFAKTRNALRLSINGAGYFQNDNTAIWLAVDSAELPELRQSLVEHLDAGGFSYSTDHGFTPHITLIYIENDQPHPEFELQKLNFLVSDLTLMYREEHIKLPMRKENRMTFVEMIKRLINGNSKQRSLSVELAWEQIWTLIYERASQDSREAVWPIDIYLDNNDMFVIGARNGRLARATLTVSGDSIYLGEWSNVEVNFVPSTTQRVIKREGERAYIVQVVSTATLNRDAEVDSRQLFDNFVARCKESGDWPKIDFWHNNEIVLGKVIPDGAFRDGNCYVNIWQFNDDEIGRAAEKNYLSDPEYWGASIEFIPLKRSLTEISDGVRIPVYEDGIHTYTTILPENRAAAWFTGKKTRSNEMNQNQYDDLVKLLGADLADKAAAVVDETNGEIRQAGMITRSEKDTEVETVAETDDPEGREIVLDEDVTDYLVKAVMESLAVTQSSGFQELQKLVGELNQTIDEMGEAIHRSETAVSNILSRLDTVERGEEEKLRDELTKLPAGTVRVRVGRKSTEDNGAKQEGISAAEAAHNVVDGWNFRSQ